MKNEKSLTQSDLNLLAELENNARQPLSQLAHKLGISQQLLSYRLQTLQKRKILGGYFTQINFPMMGYTKYRTLFRISNFSQSKEKEIIDYLMAHKNVQWIVECGGKYDLLVNFIAKNVIQYQTFLREFKNKFPHQIQDFDIFIVIGWLELRRSYFTQNMREVKKISYFGRDYEPVRLDNVDLQILNHLADQARISSVEIAEKIGVSPNTINSRIKNLCAKRVIWAFKPLIYLENTGFQAYKLALKLQSFTEKIENEIVEYLKPDVRVVAIIYLLGQWDFEIEFEVNSQESMKDLLRRIRDKYRANIKEFELIPLFHEYRYNYFPRDLITDAMNRRV